MNEEIEKHFPNPFECIHWIYECCILRTFLIQMGQSQKDDKYMSWHTGKEYSNEFFRRSYSEWLKKNSINFNCPTPWNKFGQWLNVLGFKLRIDEERMRKLPDPDKCLEDLFKIIKSEDEVSQKITDIFYNPKNPKAWIIQTLDKITEHFLSDDEKKHILAFYALGTLTEMIYSRFKITEALTQEEYPDLPCSEKSPSE